MMERILLQELKNRFERKYPKYAETIKFDGYSVRFEAYFPYSAYSYVPERNIEGAKVRTIIRSNELSFEEKSMLTRGVMKFSTLTTEKLDKKLAKIASDAELWIGKRRQNEERTIERLQQAKDLFKLQFPNAPDGYRISISSGTVIVKYPEPSIRTMCKFHMNQEGTDIVKLVPEFDLPVHEAIRLTNEHIKNELEEGR